MIAQIKFPDFIEVYGHYKGLEVKKALDVGLDDQTQWIALDRGGIVAEADTHDELMIEVDDYLEELHSFNDGPFC